MSLNFGRSLMAIPGPSVIPERVLNAMHRPSPNIYEGALIDLTASLYPDLKTVAQTKGDAAIYIANGHGAWEAAIRNVVKAGDKVLVLATGRFGLGWGEMAASMGIECQVFDFGMSSDHDLSAVSDALNADKDGAIKAVLCVQVDTASSIRNDIPALRAAMTAANHEALLMVDCIASLGCDRFEMDAWGVDVMVTACQKGLMTPAGLGFVFFNGKAREARKRCEPGEYWDWKLRVDGKIYYQQFCGTAPTHHLYGLREALDMLVHEEGLEAAWARHETIAKAIWAAIDAWGDAPNAHFKHNVSDPIKRSHAVSAIETGLGEATRIRQWSEHQAGVTLGIGLGFGLPGQEGWDNHFRIGHMGHLNLPMVMGALGAINAAMKAENIVHGAGALEAASRVLAGHDA